ncbi:MAG: hypothetical protein OXI91_04955 [Chloroflexota bacterium]|nr:hypothetical protein [Chloroflexota bacterium]
MASNGPDSRRESIWSLRQLSLIPYYVAFAALFVLSTGLYLWRGFATAGPAAHHLDTTLASLKEASALIPWLIVFAYYLVEGLSMLAERYLRSRYAKGKEEGLKEGRQEGRDEGRQEGREEGRDEERRQWLAWNLRREEAFREGREFSESPPGEAEKYGKLP